MLNMIPLPIMSAFQDLLMKYVAEIRKLKDIYRKYVGICCTVRMKNMHYGLRLDLPVMESQP